MFLGSDDLLLPGYVAQLRRARVEHPRATIFQPGVQVIDGGGHPSMRLSDRVKTWLKPRGARPLLLVGEELASKLQRGNWLYWPSLAFDRSAVVRHRFRQDLPIVLDLAFIMEMVLDGAELVVGDEVTFCYRRHDESASSLSFIHGSRFDDEWHFYREVTDRLDERGWRRAAGVSRPSAHLPPPRSAGSSRRSPTEVVPRPGPSVAPSLEPLIDPHDGVGPRSAQCAAAPR